MPGAFTSPVQMKSPGPPRGRSRGALEKPREIDEKILTVN